MTVTSLSITKTMGGLLLYAMRNGIKNFKVGNRPQKIDGRFRVVDVAPSLTRRTKELPISTDVRGEEHYRSGTFCPAPDQHQQ